MGQFSPPVVGSDHAALIPDQPSFQPGCFLSFALGPFYFLSCLCYNELVLGQPLNLEKQKEFSSLMKSSSPHEFLFLVLGTEQRSNHGEQMV